MSRAIGVDFGTAFYQTAERNNNNEIETQIVRNAFVELEATDDIEQVLSRNNWQYVKDGNKYYVIGEDALRVAKMFPGKVELRRPMKDGVLNKGENKKLLIMMKILEDSIGKASSKESVVCFSVSSESIDNEVDNTFHKARLEGMVSQLGYTPKVIEEGHAIILTERPVLIEPDGTESPYSGIGMSFGGGKVNCVLAYKGLPVMGMSATRCGDWIDAKVSEQTDTPIAQVTSLKETKLDFNNLDITNDVLFALDAYYGTMIEYVFKNFAAKFAFVKSQFEAPLDIVIAGGTSIPIGFKNKVERVISKLELPFEIKSIIQSQDPQNSVVKGCLTQAIITQKKQSKDAVDKMIE